MREFEQRLRAVKQGQDLARAAANEVFYEEEAERDARKARVAKERGLKRVELQRFSAEFLVPLMEKVKTVYCSKTGKIEATFKPEEYVDGEVACDSLHLDLVWGKWKKHYQGAYNRIAFAVTNVGAGGVLVEILGGAEEQARPELKCVLRQKGDLEEIETKVLDLMSTQRFYYQFDDSGDDKRFDGYY